MNQVTNIQRDRRITDATAGKLLCAELRDALARGALHASGIDALRAVLRLLQAGRAGGDEH